MAPRVSCDHIRLDRRWVGVPLAALLVGVPCVHADQGESTTLEEVVVTAEKRVEDLQSVPISVQALDSKRLEDLHVTDLDSVTKYLPSLSIQTLGPSQAQIYFRGITNGSDGLKTGSQPLVGVYLDEQPVTTIGTSLDVHIYDMERIEALAGPQGTLFGASSMAGTLRYITNKPDTSHTYGGYDAYVRQTAHGGWSEEFDGFANIDLGDRAAIRLVGFDQNDAGFINNVQGPYEVYPTSGVVRDNSAFVARHYNSVDTAGGRAALKFDLNDTWTVLPGVAYQKQDAGGSFAYAQNLGFLNVATYSPMINDDQWYQSSLTITGKISNLDFIYSGGYQRRTIVNVIDYSDYSYAYDVAYAATPADFGDLFLNNAGQPISPAQTLVSYDLLTKRTHEVRLSSPATDRFHWVFGAFYEQQGDDNEYRYEVAGLADSLSITGQPGVHYENVVTRRDVDRALFLDLTYMLTPQLSLIAGARVFDYRSTAVGFFGFNGTYNVGESLCFTPPSTASSQVPCDNVDARSSGGKYTDRATLNYKFDADRMIYGTYSTGFRQGGFNRNPFVPAYKPDYLTNYELGWKTSWAEHRLRFNGAVFLEDWNKMQFAVSGQYAITEILNAGGAKAEGIESSIEWLLQPGLTLIGSGTYLWKHALTQDACASVSTAADCGGPSNISAPAGTEMPVSSAIKADATLRYDFNLSELKAHVQGSAVYQGSARSTMAVADEQVLGPTPAHGSVDFSTGVEQHNWTASLNVENLFDSHGQAARYLICSSSYCTTPYIIPIKPRTISLQFGQKF